MQRYWKSGLTLLALIGTLNPVWAQYPLVVAEGTPVAVCPATEISSATAHTGDIVHFRVLRPVALQGHVLIAAGADAFGTITNAEHSKAFGRSGHLELSIDQAQAVDGSWVHLHCRAEDSGANQTAMVAGAVVFVSVFGALIQGHEAVIPADRELDVLVSNDQPVMLPGEPERVYEHQHEHDMVDERMVRHLAICEAVGADTNPVAENTSFPASPALMLWCSLQPRPDDCSLEVRLYQGPSMVNHSMVTVRPGAERVWTPLFPQGGSFVPGEYRVDVVLDGVVQASQTFQIGG